MEAGLGEAGLEDSGLEDHGLEKAGLNMKVWFGNPPAAVPRPGRHPCWGASV